MSTVLHSFKYLQFHKDKRQQCLILFTLNKEKEMVLRLGAPPTLPGFRSQTPMLGGSQPP